jgi:hypothetical protein
MSGSWLLCPVLEDISTAGLCHVRGWVLCCPDCADQGPRQDLGDLAVPVEEHRLAALRQRCPLSACVACRRAP